MRTEIWIMMSVVHSLIAVGGSSGAEQSTQELTVSIQFEVGGHQLIPTSDLADRSRQTLGVSSRPCSSGMTCCLAAARRMQQKQQDWKLVCPNRQCTRQRVQQISRWRMPSHRSGHLCESNRPPHRRKPLWRSSGQGSARHRLSGMHSSPRRRGRGHPSSQVS